MNFTKKSFQLAKLTNATLREPLKSQRSHFVTSMFTNGSVGGGGRKDVTFNNGLLYFDHGQTKFILSYWTPISQLSQIIDSNTSTTDLNEKIYPDTSFDQSQESEKVTKLNIIDSTGQDVTCNVDLTVPIGKILGNKSTINLTNGSSITLTLANNSVVQLLKWAKSAPNQCGHPSNMSFEQERQTLLTQYEPMATEFMSLVQRAEMTASSKFKWGGLFLLSTQLGFFARLIWVDYSWDVMEPITWCVTYSMMVATFAYYIIYSQEFMLPLAEKRAVQMKLWKLIQAQEASGQFDLRTFRRLRKKLLAIESSKPGNEQTAFDTMFRSGITG